MAALAHSIAQNLRLADWPLLGKRYGRFESRADRPHVGFVAEKRSMNSASYKRPVVTECSRPIAVIANKWKLPFAGRSREAIAAFRRPESGFSPDRQVSAKVRPLKVATWISAPGQKRTVSCQYQ
ncbi:MAG: hypothetical protein WBK19_14460 [Azonexus sp.]